MINYIKRTKKLIVSKTKRELYFESPFHHSWTRFSKNNSLLEKKLIVAIDGRKLEFIIHEVDSTNYHTLTAELIESKV